MEWMAAIGIPLLTLAAAQCWRFQRELQDHIVGLRKRVDDYENRLVQCETDRAALRKEVEILRDWQHGE